MRTRKLYIPIAEVATGMVLAEGVKDAYHLTYLPSGLTLSEENLHQLTANHAEFICIQAPDERTETEAAQATVAATRRVLEIFKGADLDHPMTAALLKQVLAYRNA